MSKILKYFKKKTFWARSRKTDSTLSADSEHKGNDLPTVSSRKDPKVVDFVKREKGRSSSFLSESKETPDSPIQDCLEIPELPNNDKKRDSWTNTDLSDSEEKISTEELGLDRDSEWDDNETTEENVGLEKPEPVMAFMEELPKKRSTQESVVSGNSITSPANSSLRNVNLEEVELAESLNDEEQDSYQNARVNTLLKRMKELLQQKSQEKQKAELTSRKLEQEMQTLVNNMKKNEEDHSETRRLLELECSARALLEDRLSSLLHKQQETETENKQNINNIIKASSKLTEANKRERELLMHTSTLQKQITILRADLTRSQAKSSLKETQLLEENETLRKKLDDARNEAKAISESLTQTVFNCDNNITRLNSELAMTTNSFEREKRARERLEVEVEQTHTHLNSVKQSLMLKEEENKHLKDRMRAEEDQLSREKQMQSTVLDQGYQASLEQEVTTLELRVSKLENEKGELASQKEKMIQKANTIVEQKKVVDTRLEQEMTRCSELQTEVCRLRRLVKTAKKKLSEKYMGEEDLKKMEELQVQLERETLRRCQLEKDNSDLYKELMSLKHLPQKLQRMEKERQELRTQMEATQAQCRLVKERTRQEMQSKPEQVYHFLQTPATSEEAQHSQLEQRIRMLESEVSQACTNEQDSLSRLDSNRTELERYRSTVLDQGYQASWEQEVTMLELRVSKLENEKGELASQKEKMIQKANTIVEQKKVVDTRLEQEMTRCSELQTEVCRLRRLVKTAKKKLSEKYMGEEDLKKMEELQVQLERETQTRCSELSQEAQHSQLEQRIRMLEGEVSQARTNEQDSLSQLDSNRTELERYRSMYYEERRLRSSLAVKLQRVDSQLSEANSKLRFANNAQDGASLGPSPGLMQSEGISRLSHVRPQQSQGEENYLSMMRRELDRNISKELRCSTVKLDLASPHLSYMDRQMQEYREVLYKNNRI